MTLSQLRAAFPEEGLFADKEWLLSPEPFALDSKQVSELETLGFRLQKFNRACNLLYQLSVKGKQPAWIAQLLDAGKPRELIETARTAIFREALPVVIRPDIILTETGFAISELDSVPGGIGLTAWLNETYAGGGFDVVGGADGMSDGFRSILPEGSVLVSPESETYEPEMRWLTRRLNEKAGATNRWNVVKTEDWNVQAHRGNVYRFFELFDLPNISTASGIIEAALSGHIQITPPIKPVFEEKLWFGLFWMKPLAPFWRRELGERHWLKLQEVIPYTWILDPTPLPHHAVLPGLDIQSWSELEEFSQKERELVLKISGFSELAWGSRSVVIGQDVPQQEWRESIREALRGFHAHPYVLQQFHKGKLVQHPYYDSKTESVQTMSGRVRLCPYYFTGEKNIRLGGVLATICPADKKILHGMRDAIIVPCDTRRGLSGFAHS